MTKRLNFTKPRTLALIFSLWLSFFAWGTFGEAQTLPYITESVGTSAQGRPITAYRFSNGPTRIAFVGGIHQGDESISTDLISKAIEYYSQHVNAIPRDLTVIFIPNANPDGYELKQRFNANGVDLNRNWGTDDWKADTQTAQGLVKGGGGKARMSEPEVSSLWNYFSTNDIVSVIWYHSQGGMIVDSLPTANGRRYATQLGRLLAASTGYEYKDVWSSYSISGDASDYLNSKGIYSLTVELAKHTEMDWTQNLRGFSSVISFFTTRFVPETAKSVSGRLLAYWISNGGEKAMGNPAGDQAFVPGRLWQQFEKGTLTLDLASGMVGWLQGATIPAPDVQTIIQARPPVVPLQINPLPGLSQSDVIAVDGKSAALRESINKLQQDATDLQKNFIRLNNTLANLPGPALSVPILPVPVPMPFINPVVQDNQPPSTDVPKAVRVVLGPGSTASVFVYEKGKLVRTLGAFSGKQGHETPRGEFKIRYKNPSLQTTRWYEDEGTEYNLKYFTSFTSATLNFSDDWAFHQMRIPLNGPDAGKMQAGPSHGCLALSPADAAWFYEWAGEGTPVTIY